MQEYTRTFSEVCAQFFESQEAAGSWKNAQTVSAYRVAFELFKEFFGDRPLHTYNAAEATDYHNYLLEIPAGWKKYKETRGLSFEEVRKLEKPKLTNNVIRTRVLAMNSLFEYSKTKQLTDTNIFDGMTIHRWSSNLVQSSPEGVSKRKVVILLK